MTQPARSVHGGAARYAIDLPEVGEMDIDCRWPVGIDGGLGKQIIALMRHTTATAPIIGFAETIDDAEAAGYLQELDGNLGARKCRLLTISTAEGRLIGLCTLRRNLNPNNRHITDLAKGMIHEDFRGSAILPAAFYEIALQCEADGVDVVTLDVRAGTPAHRAWERFGFQTWGVMPDYARAQGAMHAGYFMLQSVNNLKQRALIGLEIAAARVAYAARQ